MRIVLQPVRGPADVYLVSNEVRKALEVLSAAYIKTDGGGTVESDGDVTGVIVLRHECAAVQALEVLARAGIAATIG